MTLAPVDSGINISLINPSFNGVGVEDAPVDSGISMSLILLEKMPCKQYSYSSLNCLLEEVRMRGFMLLLAGILGVAPMMVSAQGLSDEEVEKTLERAEDASMQIEESAKKSRKKMLDALMPPRELHILPGSTYRAVLANGVDASTIETIGNNTYSALPVTAVITGAIGYSTTATGDSLKETVGKTIFSGCILHGNAHFYNRDKPLARPLVEFETTTCNDKRFATHVSVGSATVFSASDRMLGVSEYVPGSPLKVGMPINVLFKGEASFLMANSSTDE